MTKLITLFSVLLLSLTVFAQSPEMMSYQAVVRDGSNDLVTEAQVGMQISILQGTASGTAVYVETQTPTSNANGLVSLEIGTGVTISGDFTTIDWANGPYFIKTETDPTGGSNYTISGTSQLMSVPYAFHAKTAESIDNSSSIYSFAFPQGIDGEFVKIALSENSSYTVPSGHNLYITSSPNPVLVNTIEYSYSGNGLIFPENVTLSLMFYNEQSSAVLTGFLMPSSPLITPVYFELSESDTYQVPSGKKLVLKSARYNNELYIDGMNAGNYFNHNPWLIPSGSILSDVPFLESFGCTGYLIDE